MSHNCSAGYGCTCDAVDTAEERASHLEAVLFQISEARVDYDAALHHREHGLVAAQRCLDDIFSILDRAEAS